jgi:outer membrane protein OmpA-like peptidoglycan-associated protein
MLVEAPPAPKKEVVYEPEPVKMEPVPVVQEVAVEDCTVAANNPNCKPEQVIVAEIQRAHFAWGSHVLRDDDYEALDNAVGLLLEHPHLRLEIEGHSDSTGPHRHNMRLSRKRAEAVVRYLVSRGIERERLTAMGFGPDNPVDSNRTMKGRASNRRSEIRVVNNE